MSITDNPEPLVRGDQPILKMAQAARGGSSFIPSSKKTIVPTIVVTAATSRR
jgi:hypothetical protein